MKLNYQRIVEALIISAITAALVLYGTVQVLNTKLEYMQQSVAKLETRVDAMYRDFYPPSNGGYHANQYYPRSAQNNQTP